MGGGNGAILICPTQVSNRAPGLHPPTALAYPSRVSTQAWFPTLIYRAPLQRRGNQRFNSELLKECYQIRDADRAGQRWSAKNYPGGFTSYASLCRLHRMSSTFMELERLIRRHVLRYAKALDFNLEGRELAMTDCWVNIMPHLAAHSMHIHPLSTISGTYYVKTPRGCSGLKFEDPRLSKFMAAPPRVDEPRRENRTFVTYPAEVGNVVLFESWIRHEVPANRLADERVSISFNYSWF